MDALQAYLRARREFRQKSFRLWLLIGSVCAVTGVLWGEVISPCSGNAAGMLTLTAGVLLFSFLLARGISDFLWLNRRSNALLFGLTIPMAAVAPVTIAGHLLTGSYYMTALLRTMCGAIYAFALMYLGGVLWGVMVSVWRRRAFQELELPR